ncbi:hypothetical protein TNIN_225051 [Trichonephila inaurata madagascariensis]|uniref:Uncharacterized protein n=1 Tax=Trichonephila inaurata madagascariensis TaxID=2747483 RepID=A0A8X6WQJ7_9ARAC|nr:hypothetical protein TNIN_225051 [Trichonephila inaurata madagascariensis]
MSDYLGWAANRRLFTGAIHYHTLGALPADRLSWIDCQPPSIHQALSTTARCGSFLPAPVPGLGRFSSLLRRPGVSRVPSSAPYRHRA